MLEDQSIIVVEDVFFLEMPGNTCFHLLIKG